MARPFTPKVVTANELLSGDVIYLSQDGSWVSEMCMAELIATPEAAEYHLALALNQPEIAVGPYLADAKLGENGPEPTHFREAFRAKGPSNRFHGKQEGQAHV